MVSYTQIRIKDNRTEYLNITDNRWYNLSTHEIIPVNNNVIKKDSLYYIVMDESRQEFILPTSASLYDVTEFSKENNIAITELE